MSRKLDIQCAEAMGWIRTGSPEKEEWRNHEYAYVNELPAYSTDQAAARLLEDEIERQGLLVNYITELGNIVLDYTTLQNGAALYPALSVWDILRATPEQRARALLEVIKE